MSNWSQIFCGEHLANGHIKDTIVDEHSLLLFIKWSAEREKYSRAGEPLPDTFVGAVCALRITFEIGLMLTNCFPSLK